MYLASTSPRRKKILSDLGLTYKIVKPEYEEKHIAHVSFSSLVKIHALGKGFSCAGKVKNGLIISADTVVVFKRRVIGKPKSLSDAKKTLSRLQGRQHAVYTGVALLRVQAGKVADKVSFCEKSKIVLKKMSAADIERYFKKINPLDKAGSYAIQSKFNIVQSFEGSFSNAVGLPVEALRRNLKKF